jgi:hypothetical protein
MFRIANERVGSNKFALFKLGTTQPIETTYSQAYYELRKEIHETMKKNEKNALTKTAAKSAKMKGNCL